VSGVDALFVGSTKVVAVPIGRVTRPVRAITAHYGLLSP
jgi:hypothetical protein